MSFDNVPCHHVNCVASRTHKVAILTPGSMDYGPPSARHVSIHSERDIPELLHGAVAVQSVQTASAIRASCKKTCLCCAIKDQVTCHRVPRSIKKESLESIVLELPTARNRLILCMRKS